MAKALVNSLAAEWDPAKYTDEYRANLMRIIKAKMKGQKVALSAEEEPRQAEVVDLMERLRRSLAESGGRGGARTRPGRSKAGAMRTGAQTGGRTAKRTTKKRTRAA